MGHIIIHSIQNIDHINPKTENIVQQLQYGFAQGKSTVDTIH